MNALERFFKQKQRVGARVKFRRIFPDFSYSLKRKKVFEGTEEVIALTSSGRQKLKRGKDYLINYEKGRIAFKHYLPEARKVLVGFEYLGKTKFREYVESLAIACILAFGLIRPFIVQAFKIPSTSMEPTLLVGDHLLVCKFIYGTKIPFSNLRVLPIRQPRRRDIIVFRCPEDPKKDYIKRCIGVPGKKIEIRERTVYINETAIKEPYAVHVKRYNPPYDNWGPAVVPAQNYFMMGDNRDVSKDSRFWGYLPLSHIKGKAFFIYWPPARMRRIR